MLTISQAARYLSVSVDTLRNWDKSGKLVPERDPNGRRVYTQEQLNKIKENPDSHFMVMTAAKAGEVKKTFVRWLSEFSDNEQIQLGFRQSVGYNGICMTIVSKDRVSGGVIPFNADQWANEFLTDEVPYVLDARL